MNTTSKRAELKALTGRMREKVYDSGTREMSFALLSCDDVSAAVDAIEASMPPEPVPWHNPRADALREALREIAYTNNLTATPAQFARWLQRVAEKALTADAMVEPTAAEDAQGERK